MGGHGATRGNSAMRGGDTGRWEAAASVEEMQQPAGQEVCKVMAQQEAMAGLEAKTLADWRRQQKVDRRWEVEVVR
jgi:hypothetical protein